MDFNHPIKKFLDSFVICNIKIYNISNIILQFRKLTKFGPLIYIIVNLEKEKNLDTVSEVLYLMFLN